MYKIVLLSLFISSALYGQVEMRTIEFKQPKFKEYIPSGVSVLLAGMFDGTRDYALFHAHGKGQWWDGAISHLNKYQDRNPAKGEAYFGSTNILAWTTDAPHFFNMLNHQATGTAIVLLPYDSNKKIGHVILKVITYNIVRQVGHSLMYSGLLK